MRPGRSGSATRGSRVRSRRDSRCRSAAARAVPVRTAAASSDLDTPARLSALVLIGPPLRRTTTAARVADTIPGSTFAGGHRRPEGAACGLECTTDRSGEEQLSHPVVARRHIDLPKARSDARTRRAAASVTGVSTSPTGLSAHSHPTVPVSAARAPALESRRAGTTRVDGHDRLVAQRRAPRRPCRGRRRAATRDRRRGRRATSSRRRPPGRAAGPCRSWKFVWVKPGHTAVTVTPRGA